MGLSRLCSWLRC